MFFFHFSSELFLILGWVGPCILLVRYFAILLIMYGGKHGHLPLHAAGSLFPRINLNTLNLNVEVHEICPLKQVLRIQGIKEPIKV